MDHAELYGDNNMNMTKLKHVWWFTISFVLLATGCGNVQAHSTTTPTALQVTPSPLPVSTDTLDVPTSTHTSVPVTSTMPVPTLLADERENLIAQLLTQDYRCTLPCWGGIEPGVTTWPAARTFLEQFAEIHSNTSAKINYVGKPVYTAFYVNNNNIVEFIGVPRFEYPVYRLLQDYGKPSEIYFYILDVLPVDTSNPYTIYLFYKEQGIVGEYNGASAKGSTLSVCFKDSQGRKSRNAFLWLWPEKVDLTFRNVTDQYMNKFSEHASLNYYEIEELSADNVDGFFETYKLEENENKCLQIQNPNPEP